MVSSREPLMCIEPSEVVQVCNTNLTGAILCCQKAVRVMQRQPHGTDPETRQLYHVYNFGFSQWGASFSKSTCTHKATKRGLSQLTHSLSQELTEAARGSGGSGDQGDGEGFLTRVITRVSTFSAAQLKRAAQPERRCVTSYP